MKALLTALSALLITAPSTIANTNGHHELWRALQEVGITVRVNDKALCSSAGGGQYSSVYRTLVICQDMMNTSSESQWTENDLDTLRHEAHHVLQDCADGTMADGMLRPYHSDESAYKEFIKRMSEPKIKEIISHYREHVGASDSVLILELEAFSAASTVTASNIAAAVRSACGA